MKIISYFPSRVFNIFLNLFSKTIYWPICRLYARHLGDRPADAFYRLLCSFQFYRVHHFWPDFVKPVRFTEKLWSRMLQERDPIFTTLSDKLLMRDFVAKKVGSEFLIPLLWEGENPNEIPFSDLPDKFVIKTNHGCHYIILVHNKNQLNLPIVISQLKIWLKTNYCLETYLGTEWGYKNIKPKIMVEAYIGEGRKPPVDYKFYCFSGRVEFLTVHYDRFEEHKTRSFDRDFQPYNFRYDFEQWKGTCNKPNNFNLMVQVAEKLSEEFKFMRIDLYNVNGKIYFGEITPYPGGVSTKFLPVSTDYHLGKLWK